MRRFGLLLLLVGCGTTTGSGQSAVDAAGLRLVQAEGPALTYITQPLCTSGVKTLCSDPTVSAKLKADVAVARDAFTAARKSGDASHVDVATAKLIADTPH